MRARALLLVALVLSLVPLAAQRELNRADAERFRTKLNSIVQHGEKVPSRTAARRTVAVTEAEVNAYLRYAAADQVPVGITEPYLTAAGEGRVAGRAIVDLDAVRKQRERGWLDPMGYLTGRLPITAAGRLTTGGGVGRFQLESAEVSGISVPKSLVQEILTYYSRTPENPSGINMDDPFELPARIQEIRVGKGTATVVQ